MPNSLLRRKESTTFALWIMFLLGRHAILGQEPPIYLRSTTATRLPSPANVQAATVEPVPPPRITRSNSSGCDFLKTWADGEVSKLFMRLFLSERRAHLWLASILTRLHCQDGAEPGLALRHAIVGLRRLCQRVRLHNRFHFSLRHKIKRFV